jgi:two-component system cell cycle sensor histidine kinase/response regulator CckA
MAPEAGQGAPPGRWMDRTSEAVFALDEDGRLVGASASALGCLSEPDAALGQPLGERWPAWASDEAAGLARRARADGSASGELHDEASGRSWDVRVYTADAGLEVYACESTSRRRSERERDRERMFLQSVLNQLPTGVSIAEAPSGKLLYHNDLAVQMLGHPMLPAEDVSGYAMYGALHEDGTPYDPSEYPIARALTGEVVDQEEMRYRRGDGSITWLVVSAAPLRDASGRIVATASTFYDSAERRRLEERLRDSQKMEAVGQLAAGMAHEVNNMLAVVLGFSDLARRKVGEGHAVSGDLAQVAAAAKRAADIVRKVLTFSGRHPRAPALVDVLEALASLQPALAHLVGADRALVLSHEAVPAWICVDRTDLEHALVNLVVNARDATTSGSRIEIRVTRQTLHPEDAASVPDQAVEPGSFVRIEVIDQGEGMDGDTLAHAFEPFFTTKEVGQGSGLGLPMVYGIVRDAGGRVTLASERGKGTCVTIDLPARAEPAHVAVPRPSIGRPGNETVLVVEDEDTVRMMSALVLEEAGYRVVEAVDGAEALDVLRSRDDVDLVLTDVVMPGLTGGDVAAWIARERPGLPVLFMSGYPGDEALRRGMLGSDAAFLAKPFTSEQLIDRVQALLGAD